MRVTPTAAPIGAILWAAFSMILVMGAAGPARADCLDAGEVERRIAGPGITVDRYGPQGVKVLGAAFRRVYGEAMRPAESALAFSSARGPLGSEALVVLFRDGCVAGWGTIPKQIYAAMTAGRPS